VDNFRLSDGINYYVYRYEGKLNGIENAVVLLSYPEKVFGKPKTLRAFLSTDTSLSTDEILVLLRMSVVNRSIFSPVQDKTGTGQVSDTFCTGNPKVLAADVTGTFYMHGRKW